MKLKYFDQTDTLYIDLSENKSAETSEVAPGISLDFDENGNVVGIEIGRTCTSSKDVRCITFHKG
jgi:uncharacterized protein YuzE